MELAVLNVLLPVVEHVKSLVQQLVSILVKRIVCSLVLKNVEAVLISAIPVLVCVLEFVL